MVKKKLKANKAVVSSAKEWVKDKRQSVQGDAEELATPRITNDTVAEHREEVLSGARRFVYPLQQSRNKVVIISTMIIIAVILGSVLFSGVLLYRYKSTSNFAYRVSQIIPFPVARVDGAYVSFEDYLFEVRNTLFYYRNHGQEGVDIDSDAGSELVNQIQQQALQKVKLDALAAKIARENNIQVTSEEVDQQVALIASQGGVDESGEVLDDILRDFYDWDINDLRRTLRAQLIRQKLPSVIDTETVEDAEATLARLKDGGSFSDLAAEVSEDPLTKDNNGVIGSISRTSTDLPPVFIDAAFNLEEGATTQELVESEFGLHIIKVNEIDGDEREVAHILFSYLDINQYLEDKLAELETSDYIDLSVDEASESDEDTAE